VPPTGIQVHRLGDRAVLAVLGDQVDVEVHRRVQALAAALRASPPAGLLELVPAYCTLGVWFDPERTDHQRLARAVHRAASGETPAPGASVREWVVPVRYDGEDLADVAERIGISEAEVVQRHTAPDYRVFMLGFVPGFAFLGPLDPTLILPRRVPPRARVPAGSVAIAGAQTGIYPLETPGGWHLLGHTDLRLFDPDRSPPALFAPGDTVRFAPI